MQTWELIVHGRVQGVGFRWHVQNCAARHNVNGYVQNQSDGTVKIIVQAYEIERLEFLKALHQPVGRASISSIDAVKFESSKVYDGFTIR